MTDNDKNVINILMSKEQEITSKFHNAISEIMRLGYDTDRGKDEVDSLISSVEYTLGDIRHKLKINE